MTGDPTSPVLTETRGAVLIITLNRPEAKNAVNAALAAGMAAAIDRLDADDALTVGIITGAGGTFCSGMDLKAFLRGERPSIAGRGFAGLTESLPKKPLIAAVDGYALAGGMEVALSCDLIVANRGAKFGIPEVKRGLTAAAGGLIRMPRQMPVRIAMEYALTGEFFTAERAHQLGIINRLTDGPALEAALELAAAIAANGPLAVRASKQVIAESRLWPEDQMWARQQEIVGPIFTSEDAREGATAFAEKRAPNWRGR
ncbi:crotonase/enoyl-CoA hydratase family protein [Phreatobacter sp. AB_2022a]|uniref:crotonase/enoyl-CoA hydratase family protein n=1 Tax=Phreatobacter sp. AB_2022a TaxID=3003134 RepID=UPI00228732A6|nr:crotonase/enoyl-CoA hydratase family protein [Phreatobacter sp. AB_2022a]MCZ0736631.1 crotonase/enoyl-CoA hydratase family protein [Phreatobacter sp. AB_2022a]